MRTAIILIVIAAVVGVGGLFGWRAYRAHQVAEAARLDREREDTARAAAITQFDADAAKLDGPSRRYLDAAKLANSTARIALSGPVATMQAAHREMRDLKLGACMSKAQQFYADSAALTIEGFVAFMSKQEGRTQALLSSAQIHANRGTEQVETCREIAHSGPLPTE